MSKKRKSLSIIARVGLGAAALTAVALIVSAIELTLLFRGHVERRFDEALRADLLRVVAEALNGSAPRLGPNYDRPFSGWSWQIREGGRVLSQSGSLGPIVPGAASELAAPLEEVGPFTAPDGAEVMGISREVVFQDGAPKVAIAVAGPIAEIDQAASEFRNALVVSLSIIGSMLIALVLIAMRVALRPVDDLRAKVVAMRQGGDMARSWPVELAPVATELDALRAHSDRLVERARGEAADFAHAVKTPLAVLHQLAARTSGDISNDLHTQIRRIDEHLTRRLSRSRTAGRGGRAAELRPCVDDLLFALDRDMRSRGIVHSVDIAEGTAFGGDETDLYEMLGNLLDNAVKWAESRVAIAAVPTDRDLIISIEDDGPGIPSDRRQAIFRRGARLDESAPGQGLGLPIVREIAALYGGRIEIDDATPQGAVMRLHLPRADAANNPKD